VTGQVINGTGSILSGSGFNTGDWKVVLNVIDPKTNTPVATPTITIRIADTSNPSGSGSTGNIPCVTLIANPISTTTNNPIDFTSNICASNTPLVYSWDYGDGTTFPTSPNTSHTYTLPGVYTVILKVIDPITGKTGESKVIVSISGVTTYSDGLGISNNICLTDKRKNQGLLVGKPNCTQCPCNNSIEINSLIRSCDVVFPTVLSPALNTIYTRGGFYPIP
ncbi:PKD domain-containing protein, partial [Candidatus Gracilibacteria bacterium]|nr:PKD domain-containing protein [Candidatus Gracilibacteria bacterium]